MTINAPKGTNDMLPSDSHKWQAVEKAAEKITALYNVKKIRTPVFESANLFLRSIGDSTDIVNKEMYVFEDKGGRQMALRPEGTAGVVRAFVEHNLGESLPLKLYYIESLYRYERPQAGRYREHHQFGAEFFGSALPEFDIELICMARDFLQEIGFRAPTVRINSIGCPKCRAEYNKAFRAFLAEHRDELCADCHRRAEINPLRALDCKIESCQEVYKTAPKITDYLCDECKAHYDAVLSGLDSHRIHYVCDDKLVRGLDYYTRTVFEFQDGKLALLGGGRYDNLVEQLGGKPTPCVGFGCGIERLIAAAESGGIEFEETAPEVYVAIQCGAAKSEALAITSLLRYNGVIAETDLCGRSLKSQFKYADKKGFKYVLVVGEKEIETRDFELRNMKDGSVTKISGDVDTAIVRALGKKFGWQA